MNVKLSRPSTKVAIVRHDVGPIAVQLGINAICPIICARIASVRCMMTSSQYVTSARLYLQS